MCSSVCEESSSSYHHQCYMALGYIDACIHFLLLLLPFSLFLILVRCAVDGIGQNSAKMLKYPCSLPAHWWYGIYKVRSRNIIHWSYIRNGYTRVYIAIMINDFFIFLFFEKFYDLCFHFFFIRHLVAWPFHGARNFLV